MAHLDIDNPAVGIVVTSPGTQSRLALAVGDLALGVGAYWMWSLIAWYDIKQRYRGSMLGPFWLTLSMAIMIGALGFLYAKLFKTDVHTYLPYLSLGLVIWAMISSILTDGCLAFISVENVIKQIKMPLTTHVFRLIARNVIVFFHNIVVFVAVALLMKVDFGWNDLLVVPGMALLLVTLAPITLFLGMVCARFRDIPPVVGSLLQVIFYITPVMWRPDLLQGSQLKLVEFNPFHALIDIVRAPLLGTAPAAGSWTLAAAFALVSWLVAFPFFTRFRSRVVYWV